MARADHVIGCTVCGKPASLVGDEEAPHGVTVCLWCIAEATPMAAKLFLRDPPDFDAGEPA